MHECLQFTRNFLYIPGAKKGGTRALLTFLRAHPDIVTAGQEIHYFDREENYSLGLEWYRNQMPPSWARQITMEKSPSYFIEDRVPERVKSMNQSIKLLLIVTDPIRRAISDYYQIYLLQLKKYSKPKSFEECALHPNGSVNIEYKVLQRSLYAVYMERWLRYFGKEQIHIINGEAFVRNPWTELSKVEKFLGIQHFLKEDNFYFNKTKGFYCFYKDKENTCMGDQKGRKHPVVDANTIDTLKQLFRKYNERFYKIVGVDFQWDYHM